MNEEQRGATEAENTLEDLGIDSLPIKPEVVVNEINDDSFRLTLESKAFDSNKILGKALGNNHNALIYLNSNIQDIGRYNFTAAHEIGHVCMHIMSGCHQNFECSSSELYNPYNDPIEKEANGFASGLLMPKSLIHSLTDHDINWHNIQIIKEACNTSLEATFRRMISLYKEPCALVIHNNGRFQRFVAADNFAPYIEKSSLSSAQKSLCVNGLNNDLPINFDTVDAIDWVNPDFKEESLSVIYSSSLSLKDNITYTILKYDEECFLETL